MSIAEMRRTYTKDELKETEVAADPIVQFRTWFDEACRDGLIEPNAMTLATADAQGQPSARIVLLKDFDTQGFVWFTNYHSRKGEALAHNPWAALLFYWPHQERQVRIEGTVARLETDESDAYFNSRPLGSRLSTWASPQSEVVPSRQALEQAQVEAAERFGESPPRPDYWGGYRLIPNSMEFWQGRPCRLHDRLRYRFVPAAGNWELERLAP